MEITEVRVFPRNEEKLRAYVTITFDGAFVVRDVKIIQGEKLDGPHQGLFLAMPSRKLPDGTHRDIAHPVNAEMRHRIEERVFAEYQKAVAARPAAPASRHGEPAAGQPRPSP